MHTEFPGTPGVASDPNLMWQGLSETPVEFQTEGVSRQSRQQFGQVFLSLNPVAKRPNDLVCQFLLSHFEHDLFGSAETIKYALTEGYFLLSE